MEDLKGNYQIRSFLESRLGQPFSGDSNVLVQGMPGTGKTNVILSYLRKRFRNPDFEEGDVFSYRTKHQDFAISTYEIRFWQQAGGNNDMYAYIRVDGATDTRADLEVKLRDARNNGADHTFILLDEAGELYYRGLEEMFRPVLTDPRITVYATAQNFHNKRKTDTTEEAADRLNAFLRRFPNKFHTENPTERELVELLIDRMQKWGISLDHPTTLRMLMLKSGGVVGHALIPLIRAIDNNRTLTRDLVERTDIDLTGR